MSRRALALLLATSLALSGCAAGIAASAVGAAVGAGGSERAVNEDRRTAARTACSARAAALGRVHIIDAVQRPDGLVKVWGTIKDDSRRRSFECSYDGRIRGFQLHPIRRR